jgi:hypothetical protein
VLRNKFCAGRQFSASKSPTSCSRQTLAAIMTKPTHTRKKRFQTISKPSHHYYFNQRIILQNFAVLIKIKQNDEQ